MIDQSTGASSSSTGSAQARVPIGALRQRVFDRRPVLGATVHEQGRRPLVDYAKQLTAARPDESMRARQRAFLEVVRSELAVRVGETLATQVAAQLARDPLVSTCDHHGPLTHPFFLSPNMLRAMPAVLANTAQSEAVVVLSCANVSLNNSSFPRGLLFHSREQDGSARLRRIPLFSVKDESRPVYDLHGYTAEHVSHALGVLKEQATAWQLSGEQQAVVTDIIERIYADPAVLERTTYNEQVTTTNTALWRELFTASHVRLPEMIYLEQEWLVARLLAEHHLGQATPIDRLLCDPSSESLLQELFTGLEGSFDERERRGSYLFWALPPGQKYRLQLWRQGNELVTDDGSYRVALTPEALRRALLAHELIPGMLLVFILLAFYYGVTCLGGFSQPTYLPRIQAAYLKLLERWGLGDEQTIARAAAPSLMGSDFSFVFLRDPLGGYLPATSLDLILYGNHLSWSNLVEFAHEVSFAEAIDPMLPEFYPIMYPKTERDPALAAITSTDIIRSTGLWEKIRPAAIMEP